MFKAQILIDIPDDYELAENDMRTPRVGEIYLMANGKPTKSTINFENDKYPILKKKWQWPSWLKAYCIAMDSDGAWFAYQFDPEYGPSAGGWVNYSNGFSFRLIPELLDIELPTCTDWRSSKIINHNKQ